jgi:isopenicillin N synthase-like dioxygenase
VAKHLETGVHYILSQSVPVIDLGQSSQHCVDALAAACGDWGFFHVINHGIDARLIAALQSISQDFFALPLLEKQAVSRSMQNPFGYYDRELTKNLRDRKEIFDYAPAEDTPWPIAPREFRSTLEHYAVASHRLALQLLALCCEGLGARGDVLHHHFQRGHSSFLRLNHYPLNDHLKGLNAPSSGPFGISEHTDAGAITVLLQDEVAGLQVRRNRCWIDVAPEAGSLTINIGDMLQVWSNDRYRAPLHRVRASETAARYSAAYFCNPDYNTIVAPLPQTVSAVDAIRYQSVSWAEFRRLRALGDYGDYGQEIQISDFRVDRVSR